MSNTGKVGKARGPEEILLSTRWYLSYSTTPSWLTSILYFQSHVYRSISSCIHIHKALLDAPLQRQRFKAQCLSLNLPSQSWNPFHQSWTKIYQWSSTDPFVFLFCLKYIFIWTLRSFFGYTFVLFPRFGTLGGHYGRYKGHSSGFNDVQMMYITAKIHWKSVRDSRVAHKRSLLLAVSHDLDLMFNQVINLG